MQSELIDAAVSLFAEHGYEAVTVDQIAAAAGLSKRSFFRYFTSKDEVVLGKIDRQGDQFVAALADRPDGESPWVALRRMFDDAVAHGSDPVGERHAAEINRIIQSSEALRAGYLQRMQHAQDLVVEELDRRERRRRADAWSSVAGPSLVGAAFAALLTAHAVSQREHTPFASALDAAMTAISVESASGVG